MTLDEFTSQLSPTDTKIIQALSVFHQPVTPDALRQVLRPFLPDSGVKLVRQTLERLHGNFPDHVLVGPESDHYQLRPEDCAPILAGVDLGEPSDYHEAGVPPFSRHVLWLRTADYYQDQRKPAHDWKSIADLEPQLAEFDLRCQAHDYTTAAILLAEISFEYLMHWGHYQLVADLREKLVDNLDNSLLAQANLGELGSIYAHLGQMPRALDYQVKALMIARATGDRENEGVYLANLGNRYISLGNIQEAITCYGQALAIARERKDHRAESANLGSLGTCYAHLGDYQKALDHYSEAQHIARELRDIAAEGVYLGNLGSLYAALGQTTRAIAAHDQALAIARQLGNRASESRRLGNLAETLLMDGNYKEALDNCLLGLRIDQQIGQEHGLSYKNCTLAMIYLFSNQLPDAARAANAACSHDYPQSNHLAHLLRAIIAFRQGISVPDSQSAFISAISHADSLLVHNPENYDALASKGLAYCGLALCTEDPSARDAHISDAIACYRQSRAISKAEGLVRQSLRLFDALAAADSDGVLRTVRPVATGDQS